MRQYRFQVICHLFYAGESRQVVDQFAALDPGETMFLFNIDPDMDDKESLATYIREKFPNQVILTIPGKGRDIGAKFLLMDLSRRLRIQSLYTLIIHDKKSPHLENGIKWRDELFSIIRPRGLASIVQVFETRPEVGIIANGKYIENEMEPETGNFLTNSNLLLKEIISRYRIQTTNYDFVAGNIFWIRSNLINAFFADRSVTEIRAQLEPGNTLDFEKGTYIHSWERAMSWIATSQSATIYGI